MSVAESYIGKRVGAEVSLMVAGERHELPVRKGTLGPDVIDITTLYAETGHFTYDPSFTSTASCESKITFIDGEKGVLLYRGYPIDQLAEHGSFMETCYLLLYGELPSKEQYDNFRNLITRHTMVHEQMPRFYLRPMAQAAGISSKDIQGADVYGGWRTHRGNRPPAHREVFWSGCLRCDNFDPETLAILEIAFNEAWEVREMPSPS